MGKKNEKKKMRKKQCCDVQKSYLSQQLSGRGGYNFLNNYRPDVFRLIELKPNQKLQDLSGSSGKRITCVSYSLFLSIRENVPHYTFPEDWRQLPQQKSSPGKFATIFLFPVVRVLPVCSDESFGSHQSNYYNLFVIFGPCPLVHVVQQT